jgi:MFS family permease
MARVAKFCAGYGMKNPAVKFLLATGVLHFFAVQPLNMFWQPFFLEKIGNEIWLGIIFSAFAVFMGLGSFLAPVCSKCFEREESSVVCLNIFVGVCVFVSVLSGALSVSLAFFFAHELFRGAIMPLKDAYLNKNIPSPERATLLSFESMTQHIGASAGLLFSGFIAGNISIEASWLVSSFILVFLFLFAMKMTKK